MAQHNMTVDDLAQVVRAYRGALHEHRQALNRLNVYPVPDGDTGTNMSLTLDAVQKELDAAACDAAGFLDMATFANCLSHGSLMGARGNSGVILSQILRGMASAFRDASARHFANGDETGLTAADMVEALSRASASAYAAVSNPVEGTILTVARAGAKGAENALSDGDPSLAGVLEQAQRAAASALAGTTEQLPALRAAGVVDAGGAGLLLLFDSFLKVLDGRAIPAPPLPASSRGEAAGESPVTTPGLAESKVLSWEGGLMSGRTERDVGDLRYEVMFLLEAPDEALPEFRRVWAGYGGSIVIVGGDGLHNCHIHTDDIGAAIEAAIEIGRPRHIRVTDLLEQVEEERWVRDAQASGEQVAPPAEAVACAVVAVCAGEGVKRIFRSLGAQQVVSGGQSANPSTAEILGAVAAAPAEQVVVLPNNPNVVAVAEQAADHSRKKVRVVPTAGIPEGFAALLAYDPEADVDTNADGMAAAAARVVSGEVARASRDAESFAGPVRAGDWLGLSRQAIKVVVPGPSTAADAAIALLGDLVPVDGNQEIVTVIEGEGAHAAETRRIEQWVSEHRPGVTVEVHHGGQPLYPYLFSIE